MPRRHGDTFPAPRCSRHPADQGTTTASLKEEDLDMAKKVSRKKAKPTELIISKSRTKAAVKKCNVSSEFYAALDAKVRKVIQEAEARALANKRKTLRPQDL
jgi:hypothetical protein